MASLRPSEFMRLRRAETDPKDLPSMEQEAAQSGGTDVYFVPSARLREARKEPELRQRLLNVRPDLLTIWPLAMKFETSEFFRPGNVATEIPAPLNTRRKTRCFLSDCRLHIAR